MTRKVEKGKNKCEPYWEEEEGASATHAGFTVQTVSVKRSVSNYLLSTLKLSADGETRELYHFWYDGWPDLGVPSTSAKDMIDLAKVVNRCCAAVASPMVVHCSAGIGRTGVFIGLDQAIHQLHIAHRWDLVETIGRLREDRGGMVQTPVQAEFLLNLVTNYANNSLEGESDGSPLASEEGEPETDADEGPFAPPDTADDQAAMMAALEGRMDLDNLDLDLRDGPGSDEEEPEAPPGMSAERMSRVECMQVLMKAKLPFQECNRDLDLLRDMVDEYGLATLGPGAAPTAPAAELEVVPGPDAPSAPAPPAATAAAAAEEPPLARSLSITRGSVTLPTLDKVDHSQHTSEKERLAALSNPEESAARASALDFSFSFS